MGYKKVGHNDSTDNNNNNDPAPIHNNKHSRFAGQTIAVTGHDVGFQEVLGEAALKK